MPSDVPEQIAGIPVHTKYISQDSQARSGRTRAIHYVVIHETDNTGAHATAKAHSAYLQENCWKEQKSWHYIEGANMRSVVPHCAWSVQSFRLD